MKKKKITINGYDAYVFDTKKYTSIHIKLLFEMPYTKENIFKYDLLEEYMIHSCAKYKTREEINEKRMELYSLGYGMNNFNIGDKMFVEVDFNFYDPELIKADYLREAFEFAHEILFCPNFENGHLDREELARSKRDLINYIDEKLMGFRSRANKSFIKTLFPESYLTIDMVDSKEEYEKILNSYSDNDLIKAHKELLEDSFVGLVIFGNIKGEYQDYIRDFFKFKNPRTLDTDYHEVIAFRDDIEKIYHLGDPDYSESIVRVVYKYPAKTLKEKMAYATIVRMLGSSGMIIHKTLRDEMGLVYSAGAMYSKRLNYMTLIAFIDAKNIDRTLEGFETVLNKLDRETITKLLDKIKEETDQYAYTFDESKWNVLEESYDTTFKFNESMSRRDRAIKSLTPDDIKEALSKMTKVTVHFYEGVKK